MGKKNNFRQSISTPGTFLSIGSPEITEIAAQFPFSWLMLDMEHGGFSIESLTQHLRILAPTDIVSIVRVPSADASLIGKVLDAGADGIMVPHVVSAAYLENVKKLMYYLPDGNRGFSSSVRQFAYGTQVPEDIANDEKPLLFAQIEDVAAVVNAEEIAAVKGVDVLFVGPADLRMSIKHQAIHGIDYEMSLTAVSSAAAKHQVKAGILVREAALYSDMQNQGYSCIALQSDLAIVREGFRSVSESWKK